MSKKFSVEDIRLNISRADDAITPTEQEFQKINYTKILKAEIASIKQSHKKSG